MDVGKAMVAHRVDFDELLVRPKNVEVVIVRARQRAEWRVNIDALFLPPLEFIFHVHAAPADVPDSGAELAGRWLGHLVEEYQRALGKECIADAVKLDRHSAKHARIDADSFVNVRDVKPNVMKVRSRVVDRLA